VKITIDSCVECKQPHKGNWSKEHAYRLVEKQLCFNCDFWVGKLNLSHSHRQVRVDGKCYFTGDENDGSQGMRGFGGARFHIRFHEEGREIITSNLWHNGDIPLVFRDRLPDNAIFIRSSEYKV